MRKRASPLYASPDDFNGFDRLLKIIEREITVAAWVQHYSMPEPETRDTCGIDPPSGSWADDNAARRHPNVIAHECTTTGKDWQDERVSWSLTRPLIRRLVRAPIALYRWHLGWLLGHRFILLVHVGRRSGIERRTVLEVLHYEPKTSEVIVMSGFGRTSDWYRNIQALPAREVIIARRSFVPAHRELTADEAVAALAEYERRNRIVTPFIRSLLSGLVGWRYDGTDQARRRLVDERPLVLFTPRP